ncbi:hypothetical protein Droror1_Dr00017707 [Drosera rotundifolia]
MSPQPSAPTLPLFHSPSPPPSSSTPSPCPAPPVALSRSSHRHKEALAIMRRNVRWDGRYMSANDQLEHGLIQSLKTLRRNMFYDAS